MSRVTVAQQDPTMCGQGFFLLSLFSSYVFWELTQMQVKHSSAGAVRGSDSQHFTGDAQGSCMTRH